MSRAFSAVEVNRHVGDQPVEQALQLLDLPVAGLAFLPVSVAVMVSSTTISTVSLPRVAPPALMVPGMLIGAAGASPQLWPTRPSRWARR